MTVNLEPRHNALHGQGAARTHVKVVMYAPLAPHGSMQQAVASNKQAAAAAFLVEQEQHSDANNASKRSKVW